MVLTAGITDEEGAPESLLLLCVRGRAPETQAATVSVSADLCGHSIQRWLGTISIDTEVMMTPRSGVSVDDDKVDGVGDKVIPRPQWTTAFGSILIWTADLLWVAFGRQVVVIQHTHYDEEQP
ncbi:uncharacterized protein UDID_18535 [Ustilago sp. UG-2017a]|nr:uncharacterized protein UDID_18535 [Ustilago sp. UG-2017a]